MLKKPGAFTYYKHKEAFFPSEVFYKFYDKYPDNKNYLKCLRLCKSHSIAEIASIIKSLLCSNKKPSEEAILQILYPEKKAEKYNMLKPLVPNLEVYDFILQGEKNENNLYFRT